MSRDKIWVKEYNSSELYHGALWLKLECDQCHKEIGYVLTVYEQLNFPTICIECGNKI